MGKTRDLLKKIGDTKGQSHAKLSTIKDRNGEKLTEAEGVGGKHTQKNCTKRDLNDTDKHDAVITHLEQVILVGSQVVLRKHHYEQSQWR